MSNSLAIYSAAAASQEFAELPSNQRRRVDKWAAELDWLDQMLKRGGRRTGPGGLYKEIARRMSLKESAVSRVVRAWEQTQDWHVLLDGRMHNNKPVEDYGIKTPRFKAWAVRFAEHELRSSKEAIRKIYTIFLHGGMIIDGYEHHVPGTIPPEINERALQRIFQAHAKEIKRARFGVDAVKELPVLRDRTALEVGQWYEMDDVMHDIQVLYQGQAVRVSEFGMIDYASACRIHWGSIPNFRRLDDNKRQALTRKMALMFLAYVLRYIGYHPDKCVIMMEHATATLSQDKMDLLKAATNGVIEIRKGGIKGAAQKAIGGRAARGHGNPMAKGEIEGSHNLIHNTQGNLPLQVGWTGRNEPAVTWGLRREAEQVAYWQQQLASKGRTDLAAKLDLPALTWEDYTELLITKYEIINGRTDHKISGWSRNKTVEYCVGNGQWVSEADLQQTQEQRQALCLLVDQHPDMVREANMSPAQVWARGKDKLVKLPLATYVDLLSDERDFGRMVRVDCGLIRVQDKLCNNGEQLIYLAAAANDGRQPLRLEDGRTYKVVLNPYAIHELIVLDDNGSILGRAPQYAKVNPLKEDLYKTIGRAEGRKAADMARQRARWEGTNAYNMQRREANKSVMDEAAKSALGLITPSAPGKPTARKPAVNRDDLAAVLADTPSTMQDQDPEEGITVDISDLF